jgi:hypothetical protein
MVMAKGWDDPWSVRRTFRVARGEVTLVASQEGRSWKVTAEEVASPALAGLEFHGALPEIALDQAEAFVRRVLEPSAA